MKTRSKDINIFSMSALDLFASALGAFILVSVVLFPYFPNTGDSEVRVAEVRARLEQVQNELQATREQLGACETQRQEIQAALDACEEQRRASVSQAALSACETQRQQVQAALDACEEQRRASVSQAALGACESRNRQIQTELESCQAQARKKFVLVLMSWGTSDDIDLHVIDPDGREFFYQRRSFAGSRAKLEEDNTRGPGNEIWLHPAAEAGTYRVYYHYFSGGSGSVRVRGAVLTPAGRTPLPMTRLRQQGDKPQVATISVDSEGNARISTR